jgi:hypothetical protein
LSSNRVRVSEKRDAGVNEAVRGGTEDVLLSTHAAVYNTFNSSPRLRSNAPHVPRRSDEHLAHGCRLNMHETQPFAIFVRQRDSAFMARSC